MTAMTDRVFLMSEEQRTSSKCLSSVPADGDPLPDVGSASVFHYQAELVAVPGDLGALLSSHSFCHLPGNSKASGTDNTQVCLLFLGTLLSPRVTIRRSSFQFPCHRCVLSFAPWECENLAHVKGCEALNWLLANVPGTWVGSGKVDSTWAGILTQGIPSMQHASLRPLEIMRFLVWKSRL